MTKFAIVQQYQNLPQLSSFSSKCCRWQQAISIIGLILLKDGAQVNVAKKVQGMKSEAKEFQIPIMWLFCVPKSSIAIIVIAILLFAEMNSIASLKLQSLNNNKVHLNATFANVALAVRSQYNSISSASTALIASGAAVLIGASLFVV
ncbi:hypothetical protein DINM_006090 [Dirofilaria immitis]|nr:hypothetical protein [Dirofilaria immitis]